MKKIPFSNITVFILFFGVALVEAFSNNNWLMAALFVGVAIVFLWVDLKK